MLFFPVMTAKMTYVQPRKYILSNEQLAAFQLSKTHEAIITYIEALNDAVIGVKLTDECTESQARVLCLDSDDVI